MRVAMLGGPATNPAHVSSTSAGASEAEAQAGIRAEFRAKVSTEGVGDVMIDDLDLAVLDAWVRSELLPTFTRQPGSTRPWCAQWWDHPEAVLRLEGMRRAWLALADTPTGISVWLRDHADPSLGELLHPGGTFSLCDVMHARRHDPIPPLPSDPLPTEEAAATEHHFTVGRDGTVSDGPGGEPAPHRQDL
jgi:hypothetical protein